MRQLSARCVSACALALLFCTPEPAHASSVADALETVFQGLIYATFSVFGWLAGIAITIFGLLTRPELFEMFNSKGIYQMWQFIRDFFNLFFILTLLYIAFTTIFQVAKDYKKALLSLVLMALLVNFSFPIARFLIDAGNVPMYFFAGQISDQGAAQGLTSIFDAANIQGILIRGEGGDVDFDEFSSRDTTHLIAATIFLFIFAITLLVLAVMFVIRFAALVILAIFSPVGFAGTVIPGMEKYAKMWWDNFAQYVIYGPAAMLMLLVAVRFFSTLASESQFNALAAESASSMTASGMDNFVAAAAKFSIPIVILWMAMGLSNKMSIAGSAAVVGTGMGAAAWARKKTVGGAKWATYRNPVARGVGAGVKDRFNSTWLGKTLKSPSWTEAVAKGTVSKGSGSVRGELDKRHQKMVSDRVAEDKKNMVSNTDHKKTMNDKNADPVSREAAALALVSEKEIRTAEELTRAMEIFAASGNRDGMLRAIDNARPEAISKLDAAAYAKIAADIPTKMDAGNAGDVMNALNGRTKKEGNVQVKVAYDVSQHVKVMSEEEAYKKAFTDNKVLSMQAVDLVKQKGLTDNEHFKAFAQEKMSTDQLKKVMEKATEAGDEAVRAWGGITVSKGTSSAGSKLKPEDFVA